MWELCRKMIAVVGLGVHFSGTYIFENISFLINKTDKIGLVGKNGAGKSTMLKILVGEVEHDEGDVTFAGDVTLGYLPQEMQHHDGKTVWEESLEAFTEINEVQRKLDSIEKELIERTDYESDAYTELLNKLSDLQTAFSHLGGYEAEGQAEKILKGLGFLREEFNKQASEFSGGWRMRIELAKILLKKPSLIILDEPTNHLDIESIGWLENFLKNYPGAIIMVSHDRIFLDNITNRTIEINKRRLYDFNGPYTKYVDWRADEAAQQQAALDNQNKRREELESFVARFKAKASKAKQAQSRMKMLDKLEDIEVDEREVVGFNFKFMEAPRSGDVVYRALDVHKKYEDKHVLKGFDFYLERGEKVAFVGKNGEGKSTFSRIVAGFESVEGDIKVGYNVSMGFYAQNQAEFLDGNLTVFQTIDNIAKGEMRTKIRSLLGTFLFKGDSVEKKVKVLSGGEKGRLALAKLLLEPYNLLILDEPTNHLDMKSKEILKESLLKYNGAIIVVSHDRDFLEGLTSKTIEFKQGKIREYIGPLSYFMEQKALQEQEEKDSTKAGNAAAKSDKASTNANASNSKNSNSSQDNSKSESKKIEKQIDGVSTEIENLEKQIKLYDQKLAGNGFKPSDIFFKEYKDLKSALDKKTEQWEMLLLELEDIKS